MHAHCLYLTADRIGTATGGGVVTRHESEALAGLGPTAIWSFPDAPRPWGADELAVKRLEALPDWRPKVAHCYAGTFTRTIQVLRARGTLVTYTAAAHSIDVSRREHEALGLPFDYPHLNEPDQWIDYVGGYRMASALICPSTYSANVMRSYGCRPGLIHVIPHGIDTPAYVAPLPQRFSVAYLGQPGPDKGLRYLLDAWDRLNWPDVTLTIAGRGTLDLIPLVRTFRRGSIYLRGEVKDARDVYDACTLYVQPSASEGFGIEVLEAMSLGRPVICSDGAGASELATTVVRAGDPIGLASTIFGHRASFDSDRSRYEMEAERQRATTTLYTWPHIRARYQNLWRSLL